MVIGLSGILQSKLWRSIAAYHFLFPSPLQTYRLAKVIKQKIPPFGGSVWIVIPGRFERPTHSLEGCCSIQLSYGTINLYYLY